MDVEEYEGGSHWKTKHSNNYEGLTFSVEYHVHKCNMFIFRPSPKGLNLN